MGYLTLKKFRTSLNTSLGEQRQTSNDSLDEWLNLGYFDIANMTEFEGLKQVATMSTIASQREYSLPDDLMTIISVADLTNKRKINLAILPNTCFSLIHAEDLADLTERAGRLDIAKNRIYNAADPESYWIKEAIKVVSSVLDIRIFYIPVNQRFISFLTTINETLLKIGIGVRLLTRERVEDVMHRYWTMDMNRTMDDLGWRPKRSAEERIRETADWYRESGLY